LRKPWMIPFHLCRWLSALPVAILRKWQGPKLIDEFSNHKVK
jgi:hypothetical protein